MLDQILQQLSGKDQALRGVEVAQHAFGKHFHIGDDFRGAMEHVVHQDRGIGKNHAFDGAVGNIAFVPERDIFEGRERIRAHHAREAADLFAGDGIAFVRHGGTAALLAAERLFDFADFGALQMADFLRDAFERRGDDGERGEILRVAVAFDHLRSDRRGGEAEALADFLFDLRTKMRAGADRAGNFTDGDLLRGDLKAREVAAIFGVPIGDLQAEGDGLGVNAVRAADFRRVFEFPGAPLENFAERFDFFLDQVRGFADEQRLRGVHDVVGSEPVVQPARGFGIGD